ncbi:TPA: hypothetical protein NKV74_004512 [Vibrio parahaemolyticus]|nr:hypothetical protein [Vibrio parahaemolyticus]
MSELVEKAIARILYNKLMEHFDDLESLSQIQSSQDFALVCELEDSLKGDRENSNVDYDLVVSAWSEIYNSVKQLNENYRELIGHISKEFDVIINNDFALSGTLYDHEKLFVRKLGVTWIKEYRSYLVELNKIIVDFKIKLLNYGTANIQDEFFDSHYVINKENIKFNKSNFNGKSVYLDTNAVQVLAADRKVRECISKSEVGFVYSSFLIEDAVNSNPLFLNSFLSDLQLITNGNMVGYMDEGLCYVYEKIEDTIGRVKKYSKLTKLYESKIMNDVIQHFHFYPELRKGRELSETISSDLVGYFKGKEKKDLTGYDKIVSQFYNTSIGEFVHSGNIGKVDDYRDTIENLSDLFDFVNFETEHVKFSNKNKIASSYRDRQHLEHAYICDYFVSDDARLRSRAQVIFEILGVKTKSISINELKSHIKAGSL